MPDLIDKNIAVFDAIIKIFSNDLKDTLNHEASELTRRIKGILDLHAKTYDLESQNDVNPIKYYSFKSRIKSAESLKEKLVRKNDGFTLVRTLNISEPRDVETNKAAVVKKLKGIPDIIGIRIVTELRHDCHQVLSLLRAHQEDLEIQEIVLDNNDLEFQPQAMKNGLSIFKIKGVFRANYSFELQIKSKIEEAWGDMDHALFYKDYSVSPIRNTNQVTMNNIGKLLDDIDQLLLGLRNSNSKFENNLEQLTTLQALNEELVPQIQKKLGIAFEIEKIASFLEIAKRRAFENAREPKAIVDLDCSFLDFRVKEPRLVHYISIRNNSFELIIIEAAYINWSVLNEKIVLLEENYENILSDFLDLLSYHIFSVIERENQALAGELENSQKLAERITKYSKYFETFEIFLSEKTLVHILKVEGAIQEFLIEKEEKYFIDECEAFKDVLKMVYALSSLGQDTTKILEALKQEFNQNENRIIPSLEAIVYDFKEYQRKNERDTRADQKKGELVKESIPSVLTAESVINNIK